MPSHKIPDSAHSGDRLSGDRVFVVRRCERDDRVDRVDRVETIFLEGVLIVQRERLRARAFGALVFFLPNRRASNERRRLSDASPTRLEASLPFRTMRSSASLSTRRR